jgi:CheY-like chemotaxis protein
MKPHVLLVDDDARNRFALREALHGLEADFVEVDSGEAALRAMLGRDFAVVLLDVAMPGLDGFETAALIRSRDRHRRTAIIFVSAHPDRRGERRGDGEPYLLKPLLPEVVRALVAERLASYRLSLARE